MDSRNGEKDGGVDVKEGGFRSKLKGFGSFWSKDMFVRADKIDLKSLDIQLETKMNKVWSKDNRGSTQRPKEEWEIDVAKLDVRYVLARGTYGTVYRGSYDGQEVAGLKLWVKYLQILKFTTSMCFIGLFLTLVYWDLSWVTQWKILIHCFPSQFYIKALLIRLMCLP